MEIVLLRGFSYLQNTDLVLNFKSDNWPITISVQNSVHRGNELQI